jgi:predicted nucleic acid-binding protein
MKYLLDTNVVSELRKARAGLAAANVVAWAQGISPDSLFLSVVTVEELEIGVLRMERRDPIQGVSLRQWLEASVLLGFADRLLSIDLAVARRCARLHVPDPRPIRDAYLAATAWVHGMTLVTRNEEDFAGTGVSVLNPWKAREL